MGNLSAEKGISFKSIITESFETAKKEFPNISRKDVRNIIRPLLRGSEITDFLPIIAPKYVLKELRRLTGEEVLVRDVPQQL